MLIRQAAEGAIAITQPRHAWLAGELARRWGALGSALAQPDDALLCASGLHDIGWLSWDRAPRLDAQSGYPLQFDKVDATIHTALWNGGVDAALLYGVLPALHVSRHGVAIYEMTFDPATARPEQAEAVRVFVREQQAFQERSIANLVGQSETAAYVRPEHLDMAKRFIVAVDTMSLHLCWGVVDPVTIEDVPTCDGSTSLLLTRASDDRVAIDPWPFAVERFTVTIEGRRLRPANDQRDLDGIFRNAPIFAEQLMLVPRGA